MFRIQQSAPAAALVLLAWPAAVTIAQEGGARRPISTVPHAIVGRVADAAGRSLAGVTVVALQRDSRRGVDRLIPISGQASATTNARGQYRLYSPYLGEHYVVALPRNGYRAAPGPATRSGHAITYFPNAVSAVNARAVTLSVNSTATANIVMAAATLRTVTGVVIGSERRPVRGGTLLVAHGDGLFGLDSIALPIAPDGTFTAGGLPPGVYFLQFREGLWPPPLDTIPKVSGARVSVVDADLRDVRVTPIEMVRVTGRVVVAAAARREFPYGAVEVGASPANFEGNPGPQRPGVVRRDLTFEFRTWPGIGYVRVMIMTPGWVVRAIRLNGRDITGKDVDLKRDVAGLEIEVAAQPGR